LTNVLIDARRTASARMIDEAIREGADAVIAMRFDIAAMGQGVGVFNWAEVCAYGTAVRVRKRP
jgi:uncharacterized protein YbjQ (UPF0145 family)